MAEKQQYDSFPVSVHILFKREDLVLMVRRYGTGFCDGMHSIPAGHVTQAESIFEAAARESREEVGLEVSLSKLRLIGVMHRRSTEARIDFFIEAGQWRGEPTNIEPDKCDEVAWFSRCRLPNDTIPYVRRALLKVDQAPWFEEYY